MIAGYTAGDPMDETIYWTNLSPREIANRLAQEHGVKVSVTVTRKLLAKHGYRRRKIQKKTMKETKHRNAQFEHIARLKAQYEASGNPMISMDPKKKEYIGRFYSNSVTQ